jgi:hypothetical protein
MALPPGPRLPAAAQAYLLAFHNIAFLDACRRRHGESFTLRLAGGHTLVCFSSPEAARDILSAAPDQATAASPSLEPARRQVVTLVPRRHGVRVRLARAPAGAAAGAAAPPLRSDRAAP